MLRSLPPFVLCLWACVACTDFPELAGTIPPETSTQAPPTLVPLAPLLAQARSTQTAAPPELSNLNNRIAALQARAARLRGPVIAPGTAARMRRAMR